MIRIDLEMNKDIGCVVYTFKIASKGHVATMEIVPWNEPRGAFPFLLLTKPK